MHSPHEPIHARDFAPLRQQRPLTDLTADETGSVRLSCSRCPRQETVALLELHQRFSPQAGLVDVLNALAAGYCAKARSDASGTRHCGLCYRDLR